MDKTRRCSGAMSHGHDGRTAVEYRGHLRTLVLCGPCADAAARLGMIERREVPRAQP